MVDLPHDIGRAREALARCTGLPFEVVEVSNGSGRIQMTVQYEQVEAARAYFEATPVVLRDGRTVPVRVSGVRAQQFDSWPTAGATRPPTDVPDGLVGMNVDDATRVANAAGWLVRAYEPESAVTLDLCHHRLNLVFDEQRRVTRLDVG
jgi:hypothetical protein